MVTRTMHSDEKQIIAKGSKSFYLASLFFSKEVRESAWKLYRWCRYCDDQIDGAANRDVALLRLNELRDQTANALDPDFVAEKLSPEFLGLRSICQRHQIPAQYAFDLLDGFEMDVSAQTFHSLEELEKYGYHVAGAVGLMMTHVFGASSEEALQHAVDMGVAMQLTNISRDLVEDFGLDRVYMPRTWLEQAGIPASEFCEEKHQEKVLTMNQRLLDRADELYRSGYNGLRYLPLHAALAVSTAGSIYSFIGVKVRRQRRLHGRVYVTLFEKIILALRGAMRLLPLFALRLRSPWKSQPSLSVWRTQ